MTQHLRRVRTIDAHAGGAPLRLIVDGFPPIRGNTMVQKAAWAVRRGRATWGPLVSEPRGHADMVAAVLTEPVSERAVAGFVFFGPQGTHPLCGHGLIAGATIAVERGLLVTSGTTFVIDTEAGPVDIDVRPEAGGAPYIAYRAPHAFVAGAGAPLTFDQRRLRVDFVWAAGWYAIVDREALGLRSESEGLDTVRRVVRRFSDAIAPTVRDLPTPANGATVLEGVVLTGPPSRADADLRSVTVYTDGTIDRSPSGSGTAAVLAVLDAMGLAGGERDLRHEGPSGQIFRAKVVERTDADGRPAVRVEVIGQAWITGEHVFLLDAGDPLAGGFALELR